MTPEQLAALISLYNFIAGAGLPGGMALFIWALYTRRLVWGWQYREKVRESQHWMQAALQGTSIAAWATGIAETKKTGDE